MLIFETSDTESHKRRQIHCGLPVEVPDVQLFLNVLNFRVIYFACIIYGQYSGIPKSY